MRSSSRPAAVAEWSNALVCKTSARTGYVGSNPTRSTRFTRALISLLYRSRFYRDRRTSARGG